MGDGEVGDPFAAFHEWTSEADQKAFAALANDVGLSSAASGDDKAEN
ncbi:hypothetical protein [Brevundimonas sp. LM2]|nr:hypothetical protein [Brevundimonas sp. LM2]